MLRKPSGRRHSKNTINRLNLIPILDAIFIFIFFLLMSANFIKIFEIQSNVPLISNEPPPKEKKDPLALTLSIEDKGIHIKIGLPSREYKFISKVNNDYNISELHSELINLKAQHLDENTAILEPFADIQYEQLVQIMDATRMIYKTDKSLFKSGADGIDTKIENLFDNIVFSNLSGN